MGKPRASEVVEQTAGLVGNPVGPPCLQAEGSLWETLCPSQQTPKLKASEGAPPLGGGGRFFENGAPTKTPPSIQLLEGSDRAAPGVF